MADVIAIYVGRSYCLADAIAILSMYYIFVADVTAKGVCVHPYIYS